MNFIPLLLATIAFEPASGSLTRVAPDGKALECPLKHTDVKANISGPVANVTVRQDFVNESSTTIEATYLFPLPVMAAVHGYEIHIGDRVIKGKIARREEAQRAFENARRNGQTAGLLNQQRPNVFMQQLTNITPGARVSVQLEYVELVSYEAGAYEFVFPMVVGPRYKAGDTAVTLAPKGTRAGHDISIAVRLASPAGIQSVSSESHSITEKRANQWFNEIHLAAAREIPNKDFLLKYRLNAPQITPSLLTHRKDGDGYFSFVIDPPAMRTLEATLVAPKELVFVIDTSGSMHGFPLDKAKEAMLAAIAGLNPRDTFNLITFSGDTEILWPRPVPATPENIAKAKQFLSFKQGGGGTEMMKAIRAALAGTDSQEHTRVVCFMTDGYVGYEDQILKEIRLHPNARIFSFGIGSSVNRYLLDKMAEAGRGEVEYVSLNGDGSAAAGRFHERVRNPLLTDIEIDWAGLPVKDVVPARIPDLFSAKPIIVSGRYTGEARGKIRIRGRIGSRPYSREIEVKLPALETNNDAVPYLWARRKIDSLSIESEANREAITQLGLSHGLMTAFTSYYAVEDRIVNEGGIQRHVEVPVEVPEGVSQDHVSARNELAAVKMAVPTFAAAPIRRSVSTDEARIMPAVMVEVKILLKNPTPATLNKLRQLGVILKPAPAGALFLAGSVDASKVEALRKLEEVVRVELIQ